MFRTWLLATSNNRSLSSSYPHVATMLRLYWGHVATRVACNFQHQEPLLPYLDTTPNIKCLQHRNATSATLKINGYNIQHHGPSSTQHPTSHICNIKTQHPQHRKLMFATSKYLDLILKHSQRTPATCRERECNMFTTIKT
jgi:hypothetical protein